MRNRVDAVDLGRNALGIINDGPGQFQFSDGRFRVRALVGDGNAHEFETVALVTLVNVLQVGHLLLAGTAPGGPEIDQDELALAHIVGEADGAAVRVAVLDGEVREHGADGGAGNLLEAVVFRVDIGVVPDELTGGGIEGVEDRLVAPAQHQHRADAQDVVGMGRE